jgi:hypothetical protein
MVCDERTNYVRIKRDGKVLLEEQFNISSDGNTYTVVAKGLDVAGRPFRYSFRYRREK